MAKLVAATYGDALFDLAVELNQVEILFEEAKGVLEAYKSNEELAGLLNHPKIGSEEKVLVMEQIFSAVISKEMMGFLVTILNKGRQKDLVRIFDYFIEKVKVYRHIGTAYVETSMELSETMKQAVQDRLLATTGFLEFEMKFSVNPALIGGMVIRIGDRVIDSSIKNRLESLSKQLYQIDIIQQ